MLLNVKGQSCIDPEKLPVEKASASLVFFCRTVKKISATSQQITFVVRSSKMFSEVTRSHFQFKC